MILTLQFSETLLRVVDHAVMLLLLLSTGLPVSTSVAVSVVSCIASPPALLIVGRWLLVCSIYIFWCHLGSRVVSTGTFAFRIVLLHFSLICFLMSRLHASLYFTNSGGRWLPLLFLLGSSLQYIAWSYRLSSCIYYTWYVFPCRRL